MQPSLRSRSTGTSQSRGRKSSRGTVSAGGGLDLAFNYHARTPDTRAKIAVALKGTAVEGAEFQVDSLDTGWSSGRVKLKDGATVEVSLPKPGENAFKIFVFDASGGPINIQDPRNCDHARTAATIDAIPASSSIGIEVSNKGRSELVYIVKEGDPLPKKGTEKFQPASRCALDHRTRSTSICMKGKSRTR